MRLAAPPDAVAERRRWGWRRSAVPLAVWAGVLAVNSALLGMFSVARTLGSCQSQTCWDAVVDSWRLVLAAHGAVALVAILVLALLRLRHPGVVQAGVVVLGVVAIAAFFVMAADAQGERDRPPALEASLARIHGAEGADLAGRDLSRQDFSGARMASADLHGADLTGADLTGADLTGADLSEAILNGADLTGATLRDADLNGAEHDATTSWPAGFRPP